MKFTKVARGWYATADGTAAVIVDVDGREWASVTDDRGRLRTDKDVGETIDWSPTKGSAIAFLRGKT